MYIIHLNMPYIVYEKYNLKYLFDSITIKQDHVNYMENLVDLMFVVNQMNMKIFSVYLVIFFVYQLISIFLV